VSERDVAFDYTDNAILIAVLSTARDHGVTYASMPLAPYHTTGIYMKLLAPLVGGFYVGLYGPRAPAPPVVPSPANVIAACKATGCNGIAIVPGFLEVRCKY
jgi:hypothetical protein